jgi:hypothetical protein
MMALMVGDLTWTLPLLELADESSSAELVYRQPPNGRLQVMYQLFRRLPRHSRRLRSRLHFELDSKQKECSHLWPTLSCS